LPTIRDGIIEPWTTRLVQEMLQPGQVYFNAGANFGYYVALGGQIVGENGLVFAVEPNIHILPYLVRTVYWSGIIGRTKIFDVALGKEDGEDVVFEFDPQYLGGGARVDVNDRPNQHFREAPFFADGVWNPENIRRSFGNNHEFSPFLQAAVKFSAPMRCIDTLCARVTLDLLHLDIEGSEALALSGARETIARSPQLRLITEWSAEHHASGSAQSRAAFDEVWRFLEAMGFRVRHLEPRQAGDGAIFVSAPLSYEDMTQRAIHGDYVWVRPQHDPW